MVITMDALPDVFTPEVVDRLASVRNPSDTLRMRVETLTACGPACSTDPRVIHNVRWLRAQRAAWEAYVSAAFACGLMEGERGVDLRQRLTDTDDDNFRGAMAECMTCWFLGGKLRLHVQPTAVGRPGKAPDFSIVTDREAIPVEVKAPYVPMPQATVWCGDNADVLARTLDQANQQFAVGHANVLVIVTNSDNPLFGGRDELIKAFFGEDTYQITYNRQTGETVDERSVFSPRGKFLKLWGNSTPRFTRTAAVVRLREASRTERGQSWIEPEWVVLHNPFCPNPVRPNLWGDRPQLVVDGDVMRWTDGSPAMG
jgi:hypothetical protein